MSDEYIECVCRDVDASSDDCSFCEGRGEVRDCPSCRPYDCDCDPLEADDGSRAI